MLKIDHITTLFEIYRTELCTIKRTLSTKEELEEGGLTQFRDTVGARALTFRVPDAVARAVVAQARRSCRGEGALDRS